MAYCVLGFPGGSKGKESTCSAGDLSLIPGLGRSPGEENGNPFQYSCLGNPVDRGTWEILWTEEPGELQSVGSRGIGHTSDTFTFTGN